MFDELMLLVSGLSFLAVPVVFIVSLIQAIRYWAKFKKNQEGKGKAVAFTITFTVAAVNLLAEVLLVIWFAIGIAHM